MGKQVRRHRLTMTLTMILTKPQLGARCTFMSRCTSGGLARLTSRGRTSGRHSATGSRRRPQVEAVLVEYPPRSRMGKLGTSPHSCRNLGSNP